MLYKRLIVDRILRYINGPEIIVLHGARQVGKTHILYYLKNYLTDQGKDIHYIDLEDSRFTRILDAGVGEFLRYLKEENFDIELYNKKKRLFVFIDEIQYLENPSSFLKLIVDHHPELKLIVSGSSSFDIKNKFKVSLVGRTVDFTIFTLSFEEFLMFKGYPLKKQLVYTEKKTQELIKLYREYTLYGGYPKIALTSGLEKKEKQLQQIIDTYIKKDIRDLAAIKDIHKFNRLLEVLASQSGQLLNIMELSNTCGIAKQTIEHYLFLLEQTYIIRRVRPYSTNIRSELSKTPKLFFYDTGLMQMLWLKGLQKEILGNVFETSVFAELTKRFDIDNIFYWRSIDKKEIDFIVRYRQDIIPMEVKLNFAQVKLSALRFFAKKYKVKKYKVIGLQEELKNSSFIHPWQI